MDDLLRSAHDLVPLYAVGLVVVALVGCKAEKADAPAAAETHGVDTGPSEDPCLAELSVQGALEGAWVAGDADCAISIAEQSAFAVDFEASGSPITGARLRVRGIAPGQTGPGFASSLAMDGDASHFGSDACQAGLTGHQAIGPQRGGEAYRVSGKVACSEPLVDSAGNQVTLERFSFVTTVLWTEP